MEKSRSETAEGMAYRLIIKLILNHSYKPGELILESDLTQKLGISSTPVNKALNRLIAEGFLERRRKRGCFIPLPTPQDAKEVFFARMGIEGLIAYSVTINATDVDITNIRETISREEEAIRSRQKGKELYASLNERFHMGLADMCGNSYLKRSARYLFWRSNVYIFFFDSFYKESNSKLDVQLKPNQHTEILEAIIAGDPQNAEAIMRKHVMRSYREITTPIP